jgi:uncharacterized membrane protein YbaN (DUF454 family)
VHSSATTRTVFGALGWCAVALAIAGVFLPGLPTTVFAIAASYCFSRSSPRFARWLREHPWLGPRLRRYASASGMPASAKRSAILSMWIAVFLSAALLYARHRATAITVVALGIVGTLSILFWVRTAPDSPQ